MTPIAPLGKKTAVQFMIASLLFFLLGTLEGLMHPTKFIFKDFYAMLLGIEPEHIKPFFGYFVSKIHAHVALVGWVSTALMGLFYYAAEEIKGGNRYRSALCSINLVLQVAGLITLAIGFHLVGIRAIPSGHAPGSPEFRAVAQGAKNIIAGGGLALLSSCLLFVYNQAGTLLCLQNKLTQRIR